MGASRATTPAAGVWLLGLLEVTVGDRSVPLGGPRQRAVLALLALQFGRPVQPSQLISTLWDDDPPPAAANTIQVYVSRLRRALTPDGGTSPLLSSGGSYRLDLPPDAVDVHRFETLAARGHAQLAVDDPQAAADTLRGALSLWRGSPLPDLADLVEGQGMIARLESLRTTALADRIDADSALGRHAELVPELEQLVRSHPLDERFVAQSMVALYGAGRQADALAAYTAAAARLDDELGVTPGPDLRRTHTQILRQTLKTKIFPRDHARVVAPGAGEQPLVHDHGGLGFVGRVGEVASVLALLARRDVRLVTVLGPGGAGKTRLAGELAPRGGATAMVMLAALDRVDDVLPEICRVLRAEPDWSGEPPLETAARALSGARTVLVLDNLEQLTGVDEVIAALLGQVAGLKILATTRVPLGLPGEELFALDPLPVPDGGTSRAADALSSDAVRLFQDRARLVLPGFAVTDENARAVSELCRRLDGLPLALELAAARTRMLPPAEILNRLDRRLELLAGGSQDLPERHRSMWAAIDWSVRMLEGAELRVFAQLSVAAGGCTLEAAESICAGESFGGISADEPVLDVVHRLVDRSLVVADGTGRVAMLDTIRDYAAELLAGAPERERATRLRHAQFYTGVAEELGPQSHPLLAGDGPRQALEREAANLAAALAFAHRLASSSTVGAAGGEDLLGRMVSSLVDHWYAVGRVSLADRWVGVARESRLPAEAEVRLLLSLGNLATARGDLATAVKVLDDARVAAVGLGEVSLIVRSSAALAVATRYGGDPDTALALIVEARSAADGLGIESLDRALATEEGELLDELSRTDEAVALWEQVLEGAAVDDDPIQQAYAQIDLARVHAERGDVVLAEAHVTEARESATAAGQAPVLGDVLAASGLVELESGHPGAAAGYLAGAIRLAFESGQLLALTELTGLLGAARQAEGDLQVAARLLGATAAWREHQGVRPGSRPVRAAIDRAAASSTAGTDPRLPLDRARGARARYGSLRGLAALDPRLLAPTDLSQTSMRIPPDRAVIDLRSESVPLDD